MLGPKLVVVVGCRWAVIVIKKRRADLIKPGGDVFLGNNVILLGRNFD